MANAAKPPEGKCDRSTTIIVRKKKNHPTRHKVVLRPQQQVLTTRLPI